MKILLFGATGMVGQGALREALADPDVTQVLAVGRSRSPVSHAKLRQVVLADLFDLSSVQAELAGYDACLFCLGVSAAGMSEASYRRVTYELTLSVARLLHDLNPSMTFVYLSGGGTDPTERGLSMWARVKGATENALLAMPFKRAYMLRPGLIQPLHGIVSKTRLYRVVYALLRPILPLWKRLLPGYVTTTAELGRAMLRVIKQKPAQRVLENRDIAALGAPEAAQFPAAVSALRAPD